MVTSTGAIMRRSVRSFGLLAMVMLLGVSVARASELQRFSQARLIEHRGNDGDSFLIETGGKRLHIRLYFVDCPETSVRTKSDAQRVREQTRYFGLAHGGRTVHFGRQARELVARELARPFTVYTAFASAMGRSSMGRVYAFVTSADGHNLATLLVRRGLARARGLGRQTPDGIPRDEMAARLRDLELAAMLKHTGIWAESDADRIAELRAEQRREERELREFQRQTAPEFSPQNRLDLNAASAQELQSVPGIGPVLAARIVAGRPYKTVEDLRRVKGVGPKTLEKLRRFFVIGTQP